MSNISIDLAGQTVGLSGILLLFGWFLSYVGVYSKFIPFINMIVSILICSLFTAYPLADSIFVGIIASMLATGTHSSGKNTFEGIEKMLNE